MAGMASAAASSAGSAPRTQAPAATRSRAASHRPMARRTFPAAARCPAPVTAGIARDRLARTSSAGWRPPSAIRLSRTRWPSSSPWISAEIGSSASSPPERTV